MKTKLSMWIAVDRFGHAVRYSIASLRRDAIEKATQCMMGANDYYRLGNRRLRWAYCYRKGCRIAKCAVSVEVTK